MKGEWVFWMLRIKLERIFSKIGKKSATCNERTVHFGKKFIFNGLIICVIKFNLMKRISIRKKPIICYWKNHHIH